MPQERAGWWPALVMILGLLAGALAGAIAGGAAAYLFLEGRPRESSPVSPRISGLIPTSVQPSAITQLTITEESSIVEAVKRLGSSIVTVVSTLSSPVEGPEGRIPEVAKGSGVILDERGFIVTNEHVVRDSRGLSVILANGEKYPGRLVGTDYPFTDLAVIKIDAQDLPAAELGNSEALVVGQRVVAIGNALGDFRNTVTMGVVSGLHRSWQREGILMEDLIQTDAAINHGNSGGALANSLGQVVGINTSVIRTTESGEPVEGIGFAIPSNTVRLIAEQLIGKGKVVRPFLGISHQQLTPSLASLYNLPMKYGAYVLRVSPNTPADRAGLKEHDIILQIGDVPLDSDHPFLNVLMSYRPNETATLLVYRAGRELKLEVIFAERQ